MGYQKKPEIVKELVEMGLPKKEIMSKKKKELLEVLEEMKKNREGYDGNNNGDVVTDDIGTFNDDNNIYMEAANSLKDNDSLEMESEDTIDGSIDKSSDLQNDDNKKASDTILYTSFDASHPEWSDHVMRHFQEDELFDGKPAVDGLRRVFQLLIGEIIESVVHVVKPPTISDPDATVIYTVKYISGEGRLKIISDTFNVNPENTKGPWHKPSVATATTKAEARCFRKGLGLKKIMSYEEEAHGFNDEDVADEKRPIRSTQINAITNMAQKLNIDIELLLKHLKINNELANTSYKEGHIILKELSDYADDNEKIPANVKTGDNNDSSN